MPLKPITFSVSSAQAALLAPFFGDYVFELTAPGGAKQIIPVTADGKGGLLYTYIGDENGPDEVRSGKYNVTSHDSGSWGLGDITLGFHKPTGDTFPAGYQFVALNDFSYLWFKDPSTGVSGFGQKVA